MHQGTRRWRCDQNREALTSLRGVAAAEMLGAEIGALMMLMMTPVFPKRIVRMLAKRSEQSARRERHTPETSGHKRTGRVGVSSLVCLQIVCRCVDAAIGQGIDTAAAWLDQICLIVVSSFLGAGGGCDAFDRQEEGKRIDSQRAAPTEAPIESSPGMPRSWNSINAASSAAR